ELAHLDLAAYVDGELERNPLVERPADQESVHQDSVNDDSQTSGETPSAAEEEPASADWMDDRLESRQSIEARLDTDLNNVFPDDGASKPARTPESQPGTYSEWTAAGAGGRSDGEYNLEAFVTAETTLAGHLADQVSMTFTDPIERMIAQYLVDLVDDAGYLPDDLTDVADKLGASFAQIEAVLAQL